MDDQRKIVVEIARTFLRTPYRHMGRVKGHGVDCLTLLSEVFHEAGLTPKIDIPFYPNDWMQHRESERYMEGLLRYTKEITGPPLPGDISLWKFGRCFSHAAIVIKWPQIIHAYVGRGCVEENAEAATWLTHIGQTGPDYGKERPRKYFSYWG